jgi:signal peptidase I
VKRIIAVPGDVITVSNGVPTVNGVTLKEFYVDPRRLSASVTDQRIDHLTVPPNKYFVMGDNRAGSFDSRSWGFVPSQNVIGRAALVYWPWGQDNNGFLPNASTVFAKVPEAHSAATPALTAGYDHKVYHLDGIMLFIIPSLCMACTWRRRKNQ